MDVKASSPDFFLGSGAIFIHTDESANYTWQVLLAEPGWAIASGTDVPAYPKGQPVVRPRQAASTP